jgi:phenylacetic acid degradation protein paaN
MTSTQDADLKPTPAALVDKHAERLNEALAAIAGRGYWSAYPESPSPRVYGEGTAEAGKAAFEAHLGKPFGLGEPGADGQVGGEVSPYGLDLGVSYEHLGADALIAAATAALPAWRAAGPRARAAVCLEILDRINARSFEIAHAVMHTSGQAFVMSFQAGGTHAQDRALEAVAYAYAEQTRHADTAVWEKPQGKRPALRMEKTFTPVPRGIALVVG